MRKFNGGKACDAAIRRIEEREGHARQNLHFPERDRHASPVEAACYIGPQLFAFEHMGIEPFERLAELEAKAAAHFRPIQERLHGVLPSTEHYELQLPVGATLDLKGQKLRRAQDAIVDWVAATAPTPPLVRRTNYAIPLRYATIPGVPFQVFLARASLGFSPGELPITHLVERNREDQRVSRIRRAYEKKCPKLAVWQQHGARSILILEENDVQMTNHFLVAEAVHGVERTVQQKPDKIYLLSSATDAFWSLWALRIVDHIFEDLSIHGDSITAEIDPASLVDLTGR